MGRLKIQARFGASSTRGINPERKRPAFAEAAPRRQAQGFSEDHTDPPACHFPPVEHALFNHKV